MSGRAIGQGLKRSLGTVIILGVGAVAVSGAYGATPDRTADPRLLNQGSAFPDTAYPADARAARKEGTTRVKVSVARDGTLSACAVIISSGTPSLDLKTCAQLKAQGRFAPGRDVMGKATAGSVELPIVWQLVHRGAASEPSFSRATIQITMSGKAGRCKFEAVWFGKRIDKQDCRDDPQLKALSTGFGQLPGLRGRKLVSAMYVVLPGHPLPDFAEIEEDPRIIIRTIAEVDYGADGRALGCQVITDTLDGAAGDPCKELTNSKNFDRPPPAENLPGKVRYLSVLYSIP